MDLVHVITLMHLPYPFFLMFVMLLLVHRYLIQDSPTLQWPKAGNHLQWCPNPKLDSVTKLGKTVEKDLVPWSTCSNSKLWLDDEATCDLITGEKNYSSMCSCLLPPSHQNLDFSCFSGRMRAPWHHLLWSLKSNSCHKLPNLQPTYRNSYHLVCLLSCIICICHVIITSSFYCCLIPNLQSPHRKSYLLICLLWVNNASFSCDFHL